MFVEGRQIRTCFSIAEYNDSAIMLLLLRQKRIFTTPKARSVYAERAGVKGIFIASACYERCPKCHHIDQALKEHPITRGNTQYCVYSYETQVYCVCMNCGYENINVNWYSKTTRVLQEHLAMVFASYGAELEQQKMQEDLACLYWIDKGKPKGRAGRPMNMHEKLELYLERSVPGGFVYLGGKQINPVVQLDGKRYTIRLEEVS